MHDASRDELILGERTVCLATGTVRGPDADSQLTPTERKLLAHLAASSGTCTPEELLETVWGYSRRSQTKTLATTVYRLRRKIEADPASPAFLLRDRDGYRLHQPRPAPRPRAPEGALVGRDAELAALIDRTDAVLTLTGPAGVGKTRIARERVATDVAIPPGGVLWVDLAAVLDDEVDSVLDLASLVRRGHCLVVLDECEAHAEAIAALVTRARAEAPAARFLCTSRRRLDCADERVMPIGPLDRVASCALLRLRARQRHPDWGARDDDVERLAERLDDLPLALELAASRAALFDAGELVHRLDERFRLLADPRGSGRHAALDTAIRHSWDLLTPELQTALACLGVLAGDFSVEAAEHALPEPTGGLWAADILQLLLDDSLLQVVDGPARRFRLLDAIRTFAATHSAADDLPEARSRVAVHFADRCARRLRDGPHAVAVALDPDRHHVERALREPSLGPTARAWLHAALIWMARDRGGVGTAMASSDAVLGEPIARDARFHLHLARIRGHASVEGAAADIEAARALAGEADDAVWATLVEVEAASREPLPGDPTTALACVDDARQLDAPHLLEQALRTAGSILLAGERTDEAAALFEEAIRVVDAMEPRLRRSTARINLAVALMNLGRLDEAGAILEATVADEQHPSSMTAGISRIQLGRVRYCAGDLAGALTAAREGEVVLRRLGHVNFASVGAQDAGAALVDMGRHGAAVHAFRRALTYFVGDPESFWGPGLTSVFLARAELLRGDVDGARHTAERWLGSPLQVVRAPASGMVGLCDAVEGRWRYARAALDQALSADEPAAARAVDILFRLVSATVAHETGDARRAHADLDAARARYAQIHHRLGLDACRVVEARLGGTEPDPGWMASSFTRLLDRIGGG